MKIIKLSSSSLVAEIAKIRKSQKRDLKSIEKKVDQILNNISENGDKALISLTKKFDKIKLNSKDFEVKKSLINYSEKFISEDVKKSIDKSFKRVKDYQKKKLPKSLRYKDTLGNTLGWSINPIEKIGIYVPGGTASYPSSLIMSGTLAKVAGSKEIYVVTPPSKEGINPAILYAAKLIGIKKIFQIGGAQAVAALAYGTKSIPKVDKIVGPGNIFVATAKKKVFGEVDIDMIAGPSEVLIVADKSSDSRLIAADLIAQSEHDVDATAILLTDSLITAKNVIKDMKLQIEQLSRKNIIKKSLEKNGKVYLLNNINDCVKFSNIFAPEHLEIVIKDPDKVAQQIVNAGSIFVGEASAEAFGDYIAGPSHVLPTNGSARFSSPLSALDFIKYSSYTKMSKKGANQLAKYVIELANAEGLDGHARSAQLRKAKVSKNGF